MQTYDGKTVLITGASTGIGAAMVRQLAHPGRTLLLTARSEDQLGRVADEAVAAGAAAEVFPLDLGAPGAAAGLHDGITGAGHTVDVLINNAGFGWLGRFDEADEATYTSMITLNVTNLVALTRRCLPAMLERGDAGILNVASTAAFQPVPYFSVYAATKSFVLSFSEALAAEYEREDVTVTCVHPGPTDTHFADRAGSGHLAFIKLSEPPEKVARVALQALLDGERSRVSGVLNRVTAAFGRHLPRGLLLAAERRLFDPGSPDET